MNAYKTLITIEAGTALDMAKTMIIPAAVAAINEYSSVKAVRGITDEMSKQLEKAVNGVAKLGAAGEAKEQIAAMTELREACDALETVVPTNLWPMPSYADMLFI